MYEFAVAKHTDNPAKIEVGRPHDLNPAGAGGGDGGVGEGGEQAGTEGVGGDWGGAGIEFDACELYFAMGLAFFNNCLALAPIIVSFLDFRDN